MLQDISSKAYYDCRKNYIIACSNRTSINKQYSLLMVTEIQKIACSISKLERASRGLES